MTNRTIKFRAKDEEGVWRYGSLRHDLGEWFIYENAKHKVNGKTIGQFTGLLDKHGKEVFEGDNLLKRSKYGYRSDLPLGRFYPVVYSLHPAAFTWGKYYLYSSTMSKLEVIGNIYENPDLLPNSPQV